MSKFYSKSTGGFYPADMHADYVASGSWPVDAVEIADADHAALMSGQSRGKRIIAGAGGFPLLADQPAPSLAELATQARSKRDALIAETDYLVMPDYPAIPARLTIIKAYRQALRDVPAQSGFPKAISWPAQP